MTGRRVTLVDCEGYRWTPSTTRIGTWDMDPVPGVYRYTEWTRASIESIWSPVLDVSEPMEVAS